MILPLNVTQNVADIIVSSSSGVLINRAEHCETIGHCRTVWSIVWSCLVTIFACIWVAVHPNIPQPKPPVTPDQFEGPLPRKVSWAWVRFQAWALWDYLTDIFGRQFPDLLNGLGEKLAIALLALLAPEFIFVWALRQWLRARSLAQECREAAAKESADVGRQLRDAAQKDLVIAQQRAQLQYLEALGYQRRTDSQREMHGNLRMRIEAAEKENIEPSTAILGHDQTAWTTTHGFFILMGGFHLFDGNKPLVYLRPTDVIELVAMGMLVPPSAEDIKDRSKADSFSKLIVLIQTLWFVMQSIARHIEHLPITELEVATLAYTVPILGIYICWWNKPLQVTQPIRVPKSVWDINIQEGAPMSLRDSFVLSLTGFEDPLFKPALNRRRVPRFSAGEPSFVQVDQADIVTSIITIFFGAVHCFAWSYHFPSETEKILWRIASVDTTVLPVVWTVLYTFNFIDDIGPRQMSFATINRFSGIVVPFYLLGRAILLVVAFLGLRSLAPAAYSTVYWTTFIPHV